MKIQDNTVDGIYYHLPHPTIKETPTPNPWQCIFLNLGTLSRTEITPLYTFEFLLVNILSQSELNMLSRDS